MLYLHQWAAWKVEVARTATPSASLNWKRVTFPVIPVRSPCRARNRALGKSSSNLVNELNWRFTISRWPIATKQRTTNRSEGFQRSSLATTRRIIVTSMRRSTSLTSTRTRRPTSAPGTAANTKLTFRAATRWSSKFQNWSSSTPPSVSSSGSKVSISQAFCHLTIFKNFFIIRN